MTSERTGGVFISYTRQAGAACADRMHALLRARVRLTVINGSVPALGGFPVGCRFRNRCDAESDSCIEPPPVTVVDSRHRFRCWNPVERAADDIAG